MNALLQVARVAYIVSAKNVLAVLSTIVAIVFTCLYGTAVAADPIVGTWTGTLQQQPATSFGSTFSSEFTFTSQGSGASKYPSLSCGGTLSGGESGGTYRFRESITYGHVTQTTGGCIDGIIEIVVRGSSMSVQWNGSWQGTNVVASGTLNRVGGAQANWSRGKWVRGDSVANVLGTCFTTWTCQPGSEIMRSSDSRLLSTGSLRTKGACQMTDDPESCGRCVSYEPATGCEYCVQPSECANASLGSRTREALGCCPER
jgi:hypothetical protein